MKKFKSIMFYIFIVLCFTACSAATGVKKVMFDGVAYRREFYDDSLMYPINITFQEGSYTVDNKQIRRVNFDQFDFIERKGKGDIEGVLYCAEEQWKQAKAYYEDDNNFVYYCKIGSDNIYKAPKVVTIPDIDNKKFYSLMIFAEKNRYKPFGARKKTRLLPLLDEAECPPYTFYKESKDGFFTSITGYTFYIDNDKLVLLYRYDRGRLENKQMMVVDVPQELGTYFVELAATLSSD